MAEIKKVARLACPRCKSEMEVYTREDHSFWPEGILQLLMHCDNCGFRSADVMPLREYEPSRLELKVFEDKDLKVRVIKSSAATVSIPELGVTIEPGTASEGYISNVEGVLDRIEQVLITMVNWKNPKAQEMLKKVAGLREKITTPFTLVIEDPTGCSLIISDNTKRTKLFR